MKKMWPVFVIGLLMIAFLWVAGTAAIAMDQCEVVGNSYTMEIGDEVLVLSDFTCIYGPGCEGTCECDGITFPFTCNLGNMSIAGFPVALTGNGLTIYVPPSGLYSTRIGDTVYMTEGKIPCYLFK